MSINNTVTLQDIKDARSEALRLQDVFEKSKNEKMDSVTRTYGLGTAAANAWQEVADLQVIRYGE